MIAMTTNNSMRVKAAPACVLRAGLVALVFFIIQSVGQLPPVIAFTGGDFLNVFDPVAIDG
jgi:hypothetical protein